MKITFKAASFELNVEAPTPIQCLAKLEQEIDKRTGAEGTALTDDLAFDLNECLDQLELGEKYQRLDMSTPEDNFVISPT